MFMANLRGSNMLFPFYGQVVATTWVASAGRYRIFFGRQFVWIQASMQYLYAKTTFSEYSIMVVSCL